MTYAQEGCDKQAKITEVSKLLHRRCLWCECQFMPGQHYFNGYCQRCDDIRQKIKQEDIRERSY